MACDLTLTGRGVGCKDALGGIKRIYVAEWVDGIWEDIASGEVSGATAAITFYTYDMTRGSGSLNQTITSDLAAGTVFFDQVCSVTFNKAAASDITEISAFIDRDQLVDAMHAWVADKSRSFGEVLVDLDVLSAKRHKMIEDLVQEHVTAHGNDPTLSSGQAQSRAGSGTANPSAAQAAWKVHRCV